MMRAPADPRVGNRTWYLVCSRKGGRGVLGGRPALFRPGIRMIQGHPFIPRDRAPDVDLNPDRLFQAP